MEVCIFILIIQTSRRNGRVKRKKCYGFFQDASSEVLVECLAAPPDINGLCYDHFCTFSIQQPIPLTSYSVCDWPDLWREKLESVLKPDSFFPKKSGN